MLDLILRRANLPDGRVGVDIGVANGQIVAIEPSLAAKGAREIDATGRLVTPPFVDSHFHLDSALSVGRPRYNESGTLLEGIRIWGELKPLITAEDIYDRALALCHWAIAKGTLAIRSHVDICDDRLLAVDALLAVRQTMKPYLDLQLVAFPQDGYFRSPTARANLDEALKRGVDVVGGIPHFERTMAAGGEAIAALCRIAAERGLMVDMHCDESDDPLSRHVETLAAETVRHGLHGRVTGSHLTSMHSMDNYYVSKLIALMARGEAQRRRQSADQHHAAGPPRHVPEAARHDAGEGAAQGRRQRRLRPRLRHGPLVRARQPRHAGGRAHGAPCRPHDRARRDARLLRRGHDGRRQDARPRRLRARDRQAGDLRRAPGRAIRSRRCACAPTACSSSARGGSSPRRRRSRPRCGSTASTRRLISRSDRCEHIRRFDAARPSCARQGEACDRSSPSSRRMAVWATTRRSAAPAG